MSDIIDGAVIGTIGALTFIGYLKLVEIKIMRPEDKFGETLVVSKFYQAFTIFLVATAVAMCVCMYELGQGSTLEAVAAFLIATTYSLYVFAQIHLVYLSQISINGNQIRYKSIGAVREINLSKLTSIKLDNLFLTFVLTGDHQTIRFCHYVQGKRRLIEHIVRHAPAAATSELREYLDATDSS